MRRYADYELCRQQGLKHVDSHAQDCREDQEELSLIRERRGSFDGCASNLLRWANTETVLAWYSDHDLIACKRWAHVAGKLERMLYQVRPGRLRVGTAPMQSTLMPLISDDEPLIQWFARNENMNTEAAHQPNHREFMTLQMQLAIRGEWTLLAERSREFLSAPRSKFMAHYEPDNRFHLALAEGDVSAMQLALAELVAPRAIRWRNDDYGYTGWFLVREAVMYAKIAWRHGYQVDVDTPWIPKEWLPVAPLSEYEDPFDFMKGFDINMPLGDALPKGEWPSWLV